MAAEKILVIGDSGDGKSTSMRNLNPKETFLINCVGKDLPFRGWKKDYQVYSKDNPNGNLVNTSSVEMVKKIMKGVNSSLTHIKVLIIDDFNYIPAYQLFDKVEETGWNL